MEISKRYFPEIMLDNDAVYLAHLTGVLESVDEFATMEVTKTPSAFHFRIVPSLPKYLMPLLDEVLTLNNVYKFRLELSKSIKSSGTLNFQINYV